MLLDESPFYLLGASTRDDRHRIVELAEEKGLYLDHALCSRWSADLISPRQRLQYEVAWLPGVSSERALTAAKAASKGIAVDPLPSPLAQVNVLATIVARQGQWAESRLGARLLEIAETWERVHPEHVRVLLNEDRSAAGFVPLENARDVERALHGRLNAVGTELTTVLRRAEESVRIQALTQALDNGTKSGAEAGPVLLHALIDALALDLHAALDRERVGVEAAIAQIRGAATTGEEATLEAAVTTLATALRRWDAHAQPLQLSAKSRGQEHEASSEMARVIREVTVDLHNEHARTEAAQRITELLHGVFLEVPLVAERVGEDLGKLEEILEDKRVADERQAILANLEPLSSAPTLYTINGFGTRLYGRRDQHAATATYIATLYFVVLFVPVLPLRCYRVRDGAGGGWHFIGRVPFSKRERIHAWAVAAGVVLWVLTTAFESEPDRTYTYQTSPPSSTYEAPMPSSSAVPELFPSSTTSPPSQGTEHPASEHSTYQSYNDAGRAFAGDRLGRWIEGERERIRLSEAALSRTTERLGRMSEDLDRLRRKVKSYEEVATDGSLPEDSYDEYQVDLRRYNAMVDEFNAAVESYKADRAEYERALDAVNDSIDRYNRLP